MNRIFPTPLLNAAFALCVASLGLVGTALADPHSPLNRPHTAAKAAPEQLYSLQRETRRNVYVLDYNLTSDDCESAAMRALARKAPGEIVCAPQ